MNITGQNEGWSNSISNETDIFDAKTWLIYYVIAFTIITLGITMNLLVVYLYIRRKIPHNTFNYLLAHFSAANVAQLIGGVVSILVKVKTNDQKHGITSYLRCGLGPGSSIFISFAGTGLTLLCTISLTRYKAITRPLNPIDTGRLKWYVYVQWVFSITCTTPNMFRMKPMTGYNYCVLNKHFSRTANQYYVLYAAVAFHIVPWIILVTSFKMTVHHFYKGKKEMKRGAHVAKRRHRKRVIRLTGILIVIHSLCWTPYAIFLTMLSFKYYNDSHEGELSKLRLNRLTALGCYMASIFSVTYYFYSSKRSIKNLLKRERGSISG